MDLREIEIRRANEQRGRCIYCYNPTWARPFEPQGMAMLRMRYLRCERPADYWPTLGSFLASIEHLVAKADGGTDNAANIASACKFCNGGRGAHGVGEWRRIVAERQWAEVNDNGQTKRLTSFLCLEVPVDEVQRFCETTSMVSSSAYDLRKSIAVIYPAYEGDISELGRQYVYGKRQTMFGTRALFETPDQREAVRRQFGERVYRSDVEECSLLHFE